MRSKFAVQVHPTNSISEEELRNAYELFIKYYNGVSYEQFSSDFLRAQKCVLLHDQKGSLIGFSGMRMFEMEFAGRKIIVFCGGKTISEREYWGSRATNALHITWAKEAFKHYLVHPFQPHYIFFAPTGYKTYLLLVNNSVRFWPGVKQNAVELQNLADIIARELYGPAYDPRTKLVDFGEEYALREGVAAVTPELVESIPAVALFFKMNPTWHKGTGIPTISEFNWKMLFKVIYRKTIRRMKFASMNYRNVENS